MIPPAVLNAYPAVVRDCRWVPLQTGGGLSGGRVWRGELDGEPLFALKRWPAGFTPERLALTHHRMHTAGATQFVPQLVRPNLGWSFTSCGGLWDVTGWMPGVPAELDTATVTVAARGLAALHRCWPRAEAKQGPCSAVRRRSALLDDWDRSRQSFADPELTAAADTVRRRVAGVRAELNRSEPPRGRVVPIHGDFWPENILFRSERLTAVLDFGNVTDDHAEVDLARLLADVSGVSRSHLDAAVSGYESANPDVMLSVPLLEVLTRTGPVCSLARWLVRLGGPHPPPLPAALPRVRRLAALASERGG